MANIHTVAKLQALHTGHPDSYRGGSDSKFADRANFAAYHVKDSSGKPTAALGRCAGGEDLERIA